PSGDKADTVRHSVRRNTEGGVRGQVGSLRTHVPVGRHKDCSLLDRTAVARDPILRFRQKSLIGTPAYRQAGPHLYTTPPSVPSQCRIHSLCRRTKPSARDRTGAPTAETTVERVAPSPSAAVGGRKRTRYHADPIRPPSHTTKKVKKRGRTRSIAIRT